MSDELYLKVISSKLRSKGRSSLRHDISIIPAGSVSKVPKFVSFFYGQRLKFVCLLDTISDKSGRQQFTNLINSEMIQSEKVVYYNEFLTSEGKEADIEDLFEVSEYLSLFNTAFPDFDDIAVDALGAQGNRIVQRLARIVGKKRFDHYPPAKVPVYAK